MVQRAVLWGSVVLAGALVGMSAPWSRVLPACDEVPAAQRERARLAGRCEGRAPIVETKPGARGVAAVRRPVPDLRGRQFDRNDERLGRFVVAIDYRPSAQRRDWVIDQVPRPPASLPLGGDLRVVLSDGALVRVPDVRGSFARALALLYRAGLSWSTGEGAAGAVVGQVPAAGAAVRPGTPITLRLARTGPLALAPESTKPDVAPARPPSTTPPSTAPSPSTSPATVPPASPPAAPSPAPPVRTTPAPTTPAPTTPGSTTPAPTAPALTMPDLHGLIFDVARDRLAGFTVERVHRAGTEAGGTVIGQTPAAGTRVAPGAVVRLVLSDGSLVRVPRVRSFTLDEARQRLGPGELRAVITNVPSDAPAGTVVGQQPAENQIAQRGSAIRLNVSSGPPAAAPVSVPNLVGSTLERARSQLARLRVERSERAAREPVGTILEQSPAPGTAVAPGGTVSVVVSSGGRPEVIEVANVVGQGVDAATSVLSEFRLERESVPGTEPAGRVLAQEPPPGAAVAPGSTVRLRVSDGSRVIAPALAQMTLGQAREAARTAGLAIASEGETRDASARVTAQDPPPGTRVARGSAVRLTVEEKALLLDVPPAVRDAWMRPFVVMRQFPARDLAIAAVVLLALLALLLVTRRRARAPTVSVEPVFAPTRPRARRSAALVTPPAAAPPAPAAAPPPPAPSLSIPPSIATSSAGPPAAAPSAAPPVPANPEATRVPDPIPAPDSGSVRRRKAAPPPVLAPRVPAPEPEPVVIRAVARLDADPAQTAALNAAPRGPEIRIAARLDAGEGTVRELPAETAPHELTEETK